MKPLPRHQRGVALITALLIVALVVAIAASLNLGQQIWLRQMQNISDRAMAGSIRHAALDSVCLFLEKDARDSITDNLNEDWAKDAPPWEAEGGIATLKIEDAQGRFNLNSVVTPGPTPDQDMPNSQNVAVLQNILNQLGLDQTLAVKLVDWVDGNNSTQPDGADDTDYLALPKPHRAANQNLTSVDELRLIIGFDEDIVEKLRPYVIALPEKTTRINLNTASDVVLASLFNGMSVAEAQQFIEIRKRKPLKEPQEINQYSLGKSLIGSDYDVKTNYFLITVDVTYGRFHRKTTALVQRDPGKKIAQVLWHYPEYPRLPKDDDNK